MMSAFVMVDVRPHRYTEDEVKRSIYTLAVDQPPAYYLALAELGLIEIENNSELGKPLWYFKLTFTGRQRAQQLILGFVQRQSAKDGIVR